MATFLLSPNDLVTWCDSVRIDDATVKICRNKKPEISENLFDENDYIRTMCSALGGSFKYMKTGNIYLETSGDKIYGGQMYYDREGRRWVKVSRRLFVCEPSDTVRENYTYVLSKDQIEKIQSMILSID